jgi:hypothetical protein
MEVNEIFESYDQFNASAEHLLIGVTKDAGIALTTDQAKKGAW